jgi:predicted nucleic acid-binding protein
MISAVDTSVLLDVLLDDPSHRSESLAVLRVARSRGPLVICPVVWAEVRAALETADSLGERLTAAGIDFDPFDRRCADLAGEMWQAYRRRGGKRTVIIPDFLVGAHAMIRAEQLLARDRGFLREYFRGLLVSDPSR